MFKYINKGYYLIMFLENMINKIGRDRVIHWILLSLISLFCVGIFEFFYIWFFRFQLVNYSRFVGNYGFIDFIVQFIQVYSVLFIPLMVFLGLKYRNSIKFNNKKIKILVNLLIIFVFSLLIYFYHGYGVWEWVFLFIPIFILISSRFNLIFAFSFSYLSFYFANMLFEFQGLNFLKNFGTLLAYILVFGIFILVLSRLKIKIDKSIIISFIPIILFWIYTFPIWQLKGKDFTNAYLPIDLYSRLFMFPFFIIVTLQIYFIHRKHGKTLNR